MSSEKRITLQPLKFEEAISDILKVKPPEKDRVKKPCECGCGKYPKSSKSRFLPGHDLRKAYQDTAIHKKPTK